MPVRVVKADRLLRNARLIIAVGFALVLAAALAAATGLERARVADTLVLHTLEVGQAAQSLLSDMQDAETGQRGFMLTEDEIYLEPFHRSVAEVPVQFEKLRKLSVASGEQLERLDKLWPLISAKIQELERTIDLAREGRRDAALAIVTSDRGQSLMNEIRDELTLILRAERGLLSERQRRAGQARYGLAALVGLSLLIATILAGILAVSTQRAVAGLIQRTAELEAESKLRHEAESTLRQVQKMEAVGQLTGGIAHDFNNLLTIIIGNLDTIKRRLAKVGTTDNAVGLSAKLMTPIDGALRGARSAAQLTQRLLAFSRRQALEPARLDLNRLISDMLDMLSRSLGEHVSIETVLSAGLWPGFADRHQVENVLLNLALNARAAMPDGGCLTIETANTYLDENYARQFGDVEPGQYVLLSVSDTGIGIPKEIIERVLEPFFTTKEAGEGTGLGLAMIHGFVKQSGGHVRIYSEEGHGTTVKIYLPRLAQAEDMSAVPAVKPVAAEPAPRAAANETVLLVEDNEGVRDYAKRVLDELGYRVLEAADAEEALRLLTQNPGIDLLFTDVILPGSVTGRVLADEAKAMYPELPVLFTTGYTRNAIVHQGRLDAGVHLLNKPYTQQDLARKLRELLDAARMEKVSQAPT